MRFTTMSNLIRHHKAGGGCWFDDGAMAFFNTVIETAPMRLNVFITKDRPGAGHPWMWTVRRYDHTTRDVETIGEFYHHETFDAAMDAARAYINDNDTKGS